MFGGLEIKGSSGSGASKPAENGGKEKSAAPAANSSGFSFLSPTTNDASPAATAASSSAFSFMSSSNDKPLSEPEQKDASAGSGFSFMSQQQQQPEKKDEPPSSPAKAPAASSFDFLATTTSTSAAATVESPASPSAAADSGFSFLSAPVPEPAATAAATGNDGAKAAEPVPAPSPKSPKPDLLSTANAHQPVGSGVVFGGAISAAAKKPINRRRRTTHIGAGASNNTASSTMTMSSASSSLPPPAAMSSPTTPEKKSAGGGGFVPPSLDKPPEETSTKSTAEAAQDAARRADELIQSKMAAITTTTSSPLPPSYAKARDPTSPQDDDYVEAKAAALEAKAQMSTTKKPFRQMGERMGGLFKKGFRGNERSSSWSNNSARSIPDLTPPPSIPKALGNGEETAVERIQREQEEIKKAVAERTLAFNKQQQEQKQTEQPAKPPTPPPPPPPPPKPKTPQEKMEDIIKVFAKNSSAAMDRVSHLRHQRLKLLEERAVSEKKLLVASQQIAQAEEQQTLAVEEEEFELADRLAAVMDKWESGKKELSRILDNIDGALKQLNEQQQAVVNGVAACFRQVQTQLSRFEEEQESTERKDDTDAMQRFSNISKQLSAENERLQNDLKLIERDEDLAVEERRDLDKAIGEQTAEVEKTRGDAMQKLETVQDEIEELKERLAAREAVAKQLMDEVKEHDAAIARVKVTFSSQIRRVQRKEANVKENRSEWTTEKERYEKDKETHDAEVKAHSEALLTHDELMKQLKAEISVAEELEKIVEETVSFDGSQEEGDTDDSGLSELQTKVVEGEAAVEEASQRVKAAEAILEGLDKEHKTLQERIPSLESEKRVAAARRDFKTAGRANKEIKEASARLKECEEELNGEALSRVESANEELEKLEADLKSNRLLLEVKEKEKGVATMKELADKIRRLITTKKSVCGDQAENSVKAVGAIVLNRQIKALQKEGEIYGAKFGGWDALMEDLYKEEADEDSKPTKDEKQPDKKVTSKPKKRGSSAELDKEKIAKFKVLTQRLKHAEESLEAAVEREDYDEAAELDTVFQQIQADVEELGLTDAEMELAMAEPDESSEEAKTDNEADAQETVEKDKETDGNVPASTETMTDAPQEDDPDDGASPGTEDNDGDGAEHSGAAEKVLPTKVPTDREDVDEEQPEKASDEEPCEKIDEAVADPEKHEELKGEAEADGDSQAPDAEEKDKEADKSNEDDAKMNGDHSTASETAAEQRGNDSEEVAIQEEQD